VRQLKSLALPFSALVVLPGLILLSARSSPFGINAYSIVAQSVIGSLICLLGVTLLVITMRMFIMIGRGTLAPWDPTSRLVTGGIYGHVRNPMISGVLIALLGESVLLGSLGIFLWKIIFFAANTIYFHYSEEKGLEKRFGDEYLEYREHVPMWLPRLRPWHKPGGGMT
jgi:protein-S-isoprenylcysteine O-methyltransferase Ste14